MKIKLEDLRREAYVDAIYAKMENDNVVGVFSDKFDALLISYGFIVYPIIGLDSYVFDYYKLENVSDPINYTIAYLKTKKCPLIYYSKNTDKKIVYEKDLKNFLENLDNRNFDEKIYFESLGKIEKINQILKDLQESDISGTLLYKLEFYIRFIKNLDDRISFLLDIKSKYKKKNIKRKIIKATCPFAISDIIDKKVYENYKISKSKKPDFTFKNCIYEADKILTYEEI